MAQRDRHTRSTTTTRRPCRRDRATRPAPVPPFPAPGQTHDPRPSGRRALPPHQHQHQRHPERASKRRHPDALASRLLGAPRATPRSSGRALLLPCALGPRRALFFPPRPLHPPGSPPCAHKRSLRVPISRRHETRADYSALTIGRAPPFARRRTKGGPSGFTGRRGSPARTETAYRLNRDQKWPIASRCASAGTFASRGGTIARPGSIGSLSVKCAYVSVDRDRSVNSPHAPPARRPLISRRIGISANYSPILSVRNKNATLYSFSLSLLLQHSGRSLIRAL